MQGSTTRSKSGGRAVSVLLAIVVPLILATCWSGSAWVANSSTGGSGTGGTTIIKVGGIETAQYFTGAEIGAEARFERFNDTNEMPGVNRVRR